MKERKDLLVDDKGERKRENFVKKEKEKILFSSRPLVSNVQRNGWVSRVRSPPPLPPPLHSSSLHRHHFFHLDITIAIRVILLAIHHHHHFYLAISTTIIIVIVIVSAVRWLHIKTLVHGLSKRPQSHNFRALSVSQDYYYYYFGRDCCNYFSHMYY